MLRILFINLYFKILSLTVVDVNDGEAFTYVYTKKFFFNVRNNGLRMYIFPIIFVLYLNEPWFQFAINNDIISIALEAMPVASHHRGHRAQ